MFSNRPKAELIVVISGARNEEICQNMLKLLDLLIQEVRVENDTAEENVILRNQGKVQAYTGLKEIIERCLPSANRLA